MDLILLFASATCEGQRSSASMEREGKARAQRLSWSAIPHPTSSMRRARWNSPWSATRSQSATHASEGFRALFQYPRLSRGEGWPELAVR